MSDFIVIGGGVIGLMTALRLQQEGCAVTVLERDTRPAQRSSWAGGGILCPLRPWEEPPEVVALWQASLEAWDPLWEMLKQSVDIDIEHRVTGIEWRLPLVAARSLQRWHQDQRWWLQATPSGALNPALGQVRTPRLGPALARRFHQLGGELRLGVDARLWRRGDRVEGVEWPDGTRKAAVAVVLAAGAWSGVVARMVGVPLEVVPVRGQMLLFKHPAAPSLPVIVGESAYIIPRADGHLLAGSTVELAGFDQRVTAEARTQLMDAMALLCPELSGAELIGQWCGLRPGHAAGVPKIGRSPMPGLWINTGHYRNGIALAPASADRLVSELLATA